MLPIRTMPVAAMLAALALPAGAQTPTSNAPASSPAAPSVSVSPAQPPAAAKPNPPRPAPREAAEKPAPRETAARTAPRSRGASLEGTWTGAWNGHYASTVTIAGGRLVSYTAAGLPMQVTHSRVSGGTATFGTDRYTVTMRATGPGRASAELSGFGGPMSMSLIRN